MDPNFIRAIRNLHSASHESHVNLRVMLDEAIKSKYGPGKEVGSFLTIPSSFQEFPVISSGTSRLIDESEDAKLCSSTELELDLLLKEDLMCTVCQGISVGARNRLVECRDCRNLYHQECHQPKITDDEIESSTAWACANCKIKK